MEIRKPIKDYFPYKAGQSVKLLRFIDSINMGEVTFKIDTGSFYYERLVKSGDCDAGWAVWKEYENLEYFQYNLTNQTNKSKIIRIEIIGGYAKDYYINDSDKSKLKLSFYDSNFELEFGIGAAIMDGSSYCAVDSIIINNKNFGTGFCIKRKVDYFSNDSVSLYFNSTYGIIQYYNQATKENFVYTN